MVRGDRRAPADLEPGARGAGRPVFLSTFEKQLDAKRRIVVPEEFRAAAVGPFDGVFCFPSIEADCIEGGGKALFDTLRGADRRAAVRRPACATALETIVLGGMAQLAFDTAGRITLPEALCEQFGLTDWVVGGRPGRPLPDLVARRLRGPPRAPARWPPARAWPPCARSSAWPRWRRRRHMSDAAPHPPSCWPRCWRRCARRPARLIVDGTFGAGGYSRAFLARRRRGRRLRPRPVRRALRRPSSTGADRLPPGARAVLRHGRGGRRRRRGRRGPRSRRLLHAARPGRARLLLHARRSAGHAYVQRGAGRRRSGQRGRSGRAGADLPALRRGAPGAAGRREPWCAGEAKRPSPAPSIWPRWWRRRSAAGEGRRSIRRPGCSRRSESRSMRNWPNWRRGSWPPSAP